MFVEHLILMPPPRKSCFIFHFLIQLETETEREEGGGERVEGRDGQMDEGENIEILMR